jgi:YD repeat-containing protein
VTGVVAHAYDADFRVVSQSVNGGSSVGFAYDDDSLLTQAGSLAIARNPGTGWIDGTTLDGVETSRTYNGFGEIDSLAATVDGEPVFATTYVRDRLGRITQKTETIEGGTSVYEYAYDDGGRLVRADKDGALLGAYNYDANDNRLGYDGTFGPASGTYDAQDRLLAYADADYTFDADGYLVSMSRNGALTTYDYDAMGSLRRVVLPTGITLEYLVDGQNRRIGKSIDGVPVQGFLYQDQLNPVAELDGDGNIASRFVYGTRAHVPD